MRAWMLAFSVSIFIPISALAQWNLVWSDEFSYSGKPDPKKWTYELGGNGFGNQELQLYTNHLQNARVEDGHLVITAQKENMGFNAYTSARLNSKIAWTYGRFEVRAILPRGRGTWPAIWMLPKGDGYGDGGWPDNGEVDIMEHVGFDPGVIHGSLHMNAFNWMKGNEKTAVLNVPDMDKQYHVYAMEWDPEEISFFVDSTRYFTYRNPHISWMEWPFDKEFYFILNIAVGGSWGGAHGVDDSIFPQKMLVDYVRAYEAETSGR